MKPQFIKIEVERIVNLVAGFGWLKIEEKVSSGKVTITFEKTVDITEVKED